MSSKKSRITVIILIMSLLLGSSFASVFAETKTNTNAAADMGTGDTVKSEFRVIGYYSGDLFNEPVERLQFDRMTHLMYAFLIPKEDGTFVPLGKPDQLREIVAAGHKEQTKIFIAIGGWSYQNVPLSSTFEKLAASKESRARFIENTVKILKEYDLDGVELDWEYPNPGISGQNYELLVTEMSKVLKAENKQFTAAVSGAWSAKEGPQASKLVTGKCLDAFDFINVMAYDLNQKDHSPLWFANTSIDYWLNRGMPAEKIVLGMPLYARPSWIQYRHLVQENPANALQDYAATSPLESYYNGLNTLREKTIIALRKAGGVMFFDINEDTTDETSALSMASQTVKKLSALPKQELRSHITLVIDKRELPFSPEEGLGVPYVDENNRTLVPLRKPLEAIGAQVSYDSKNGVVTAVKDQIEVKVVIGCKKISVNGKDCDLDTQAILRENRTYIPIRAVLEAFGYDLKWNSVSSTIYADKKN